MSEQETFTAMLDRAGIGFGIRNDVDGETGVQVECEESEAVTNWQFDAYGKLIGVSVCD